MPRACPDCGNPDIAPVGRGTERLEEQLAMLLPEARIARIDADSTRRKGALEAPLGAVHAGEVDVLVGTQMVAKGHDFRRISLVAAVNPDTSLFSSDFRAPERLFALLMQAAGRAGRDAASATPSEMWLQTWHPTHPLYQALGRHDYAAFAAGQLNERASAGLPPFSHLAVLRAEAKTVDAARAFLEAAAAAARQLAESRDDVMIYAPVPLDIARVADVERMQMLVESASRQRLQALLRAWLPQLDALHASAKRCRAARAALGDRRRSADDLTMSSGAAREASPSPRATQRRASVAATSASSKVARTSSSTAAPRSAGGSSVSISASRASASSRSSAPRWR